MTFVCVEMVAGYNVPDVLIGMDRTHLASDGTVPGNAPTVGWNGEGAIFRIGDGFAWWKSGEGFFVWFFWDGLFAYYRVWFVRFTILGVVNSPTTAETGRGRGVVVSAVLRCFFGTFASD